MPIALDGDPVDVYLNSDEPKPIETRPAFVCKYLTNRQMREYYKALTLYTKAYDANEDNAFDLGEAVVRLAMTGTKNLPDKPMCELLTDVEMLELSAKIPIAITISELDKKKLLSASPSIGVNSEPAANSTTANGSATPALATPTSNS